MSNHSAITKTQQNKQAQTNVDKAKIDKAKAEVSIQDKQQFERIARLWDIYNRIEKKEEVEIVGGPMDILREVGQFLVELSSKDNEIGVQQNSPAIMEYRLHNIGTEQVIDSTVNIEPAKSIDVDKLEHLVERILSTMPTSETPEVQIKVADTILPDTNITVKHVDGVLSVQIDSNHADAITLLGHQGAALQQMLETRTGEPIIVELNSERVEAREESEERQKEEQKNQNKEEDSNIG